MLDWMKDRGLVSTDECVSLSKTLDVAIDTEISFYDALAIVRVGHYKSIRRDEKYKFITMQRHQAKAAKAVYPGLDVTHLTYDQKDIAINSGYGVKTRLLNGYKVKS